MQEPPQETTVPEAPPDGTVERWCWSFVLTRDLTSKLFPPTPPDPGSESAWEEQPIARRIAAPGRPAELKILARSPRTPKNMAPKATRAGLVHTFLHHELQAAELFAWAILAFPETPIEFRSGLLRLCGEELGHLHLYAAHLETLGAQIGDFPVRDWFWERVPACESPASFVALQGLGLEGANLEHSARFAAAFRAADDNDGARILERVEHDEVAHVAFAIQWFEHFTARPLDYDTFRAALPKPLTPAALRGRPLNHIARKRAGFDAAFLEQLAAEPPTSRRRPS